MASPQASSLRSAVEQLLGDDDLEHFVRSRRDEGVGWRHVSMDLYLVTRVSVTHETLRSWFPDEATEAAS